MNRTDFGSFSLELPDQWEAVTMDTVPQIADRTNRRMVWMPDGNILYFEHGAAAYDRSGLPEILPLSERRNYAGYDDDSTQVMFTDDPSSIDTNLLNIHVAWYDSIAGRRFKFFLPKKFGYGFTGIWSDSLGRIKPEGSYGFSAYAKHVDSLTARQVLQVMKTLQVQPLDAP